MPAVSVILPVYNAEKTIARACRSLCEQSETDHEVIAVDDGSTDRTPALLQDLAIGDRRLHVCRLPHRGLVHALSEGIKRASSPYIARMDADDVSAPARLALQRAFLDAHHHVGLVSCKVDYVGCRETQRGYASYVDWINTVCAPEDMALYRFVESPLAHPSVMFRRGLVEQYGGYRDGPFPEDYDLWLRWMEQGVRMAKLRDRLLQWYDAPNRLSRLDRRYSPEAFYACKAHYLASWLARHNPQHPDVVIWGAGRPTRLRAALLEKHGVRITAYIDVDPAKIGQAINARPVWGADDLPPPGRYFVIPYVGSRGARGKIERVLQRRGYRVGVDYICAA